MSVQLAPWMQAVDAQIQAYDGINKLITAHLVPKSFTGTICRLLSVAQPYDWGSDASAAVRAAGGVLPADTELNFWNLGAGPSWWYFTTPIPIQTETGLTNASRIRALLFGWVTTEFERERKSFVIVSFVDALNVGLTPTHIFTWRNDETLSQMVARTRQSSIGYGGGGSKIPPSDLFVDAAESIGRFVLAGLTWMRQKVVIQTEGNIERHRRKELERKTGSKIRSVQLVQLRRAEHVPKDREETDEEKAHREWSCRWMVGLGTNGFWRQQACGAGMKERRLTFIAPFMKGPANKPLRLSAPPKVYIVNR